MKRKWTLLVTPEGVAYYGEGCPCGTSAFDVRLIDFRHGVVSFPNQQCPECHYQMEHFRGSAKEGLDLHLVADIAIEPMYQEREP